MVRLNRSTHSNDGFGHEIGKGQKVRTDMRVGPNKPCPCQGGKKYKKCHGALPADENKFGISYSTG